MINLKKKEETIVVPESKGPERLGVGLGWDPEDNGQPFDLDASAFMLGADGQLVDEPFFVFYNNPASPEGAVMSSGDDRTGDSSDGGDDETLFVDVTLVDPRVQQIVFAVTIHEAEERGQNFGQVRNSFIRVYDLDTLEEIARFNLGEDFTSETGVQAGRLYRDGSTWHFEALGLGVKGRLEELLGIYAAKFC